MAKKDPMTGLLKGLVLLVNDKTLTKSMLRGGDADAEIALGARVVTAAEWDAFKTGSMLKNESAQKQS